MAIFVLCAYVLIQASTTTILIAKAQSADSVTIDVLTPFTQLKNSNVISLVVRFENASSEAVEFSPELSIPEGWRLLIPLGAINLAANSGQTIPFSVIAPPSSYAGEYSLDIALPSSFADRQEQSFSVEVIALEEVQLSVVSQPDYVLDGNYTIEYLLRNNGNEVQAYTLRPEDSIGYDMTLSQNSVTLAPQESIALTLEVTVPEVTRQRSHDVTLVVTNISNTAVSPVSSLRTAVDIVPSTLSNDLMWHYFPLELSATTNFNTARANPLDSILSNTNLSLSGSGKLFDEDPGNFRLNASITGQFNSPTFFGEYRHPNFTVSAGKFSTSLGNLLGTTSSWGAALENDWELYDTVTLNNKVLINSAGDFGLALSPTIYWDETTPIEFHTAVLVPSIFGIDVDGATNETVNSDTSSVALDPQINAFDVATLLNPSIISTIPPATVALTSTPANRTTRLGTSVNIRPQDERFRLKASYILELENPTRPAAGSFDLDTNLNFNHTLKNNSDSEADSTSSTNSFVNRHRLSGNFNHTQAAYLGAIDDSLSYGVTYYYFNSDYNLNFSSYANFANNLTRLQHAQTYGMNLRGTLSNLANMTWLVGSSLYTKDFGEDESGFSVRLQATFPLIWNSTSANTQNTSFTSYAFNTAYTTQSLTWEQTNKRKTEKYKDLSNLSLLKYQGDVSIPFIDSANNHNNSLRATLSSVYDLNQYTINQLGIGASYTHTIDPFNLNIGANYRPLNDDYFQVNAGATVRLNTGNQFNVKSTASFYTENDPTISISLGSKWFLDVPTSQLTSVGQVKGSLKRSNGQPVANTVVEVSGARVVTQEDGSFNFPAIPAGQAFFRIPIESLNQGEMTNPPSPYVFDVIARENHELNFEIVETATLQGKITYNSNDDRSSVQVSTPEQEVIGGLIIILIHGDGTTIRREISNSSGEFEFLSLLPGEWSVQLRHSLAEDDFKVILENNSLQVAEGETASLNISIEPVRRPIRFIDGGNVGSN